MQALMLMHVLSLSLSLSLPLSPPFYLSVSAGVKNTLVQLFGEQNVLKLILKHKSVIVRVTYVLGECTRCED